MLNIYRKETVERASEDGDGPERVEALVPLDVDEDFDNQKRNAVQWIKNSYLQDYGGDPGDELVVARPVWSGSLSIERRIRLEPDEDE